MVILITFQILKVQFIVYTSSVRQCTYKRIVLAGIKQLQYRYWNWRNNFLLQNLLIKLIILGNTKAQFIPVTALCMMGLTQTERLFHILAFLELLLPRKQIVIKIYCTSNNTEIMVVYINEYNAQVCMHYT